MEALLDTVRKIGVFFLSADYTKYALGFFQLASMAELAIVIRHYVNQLKNAQRKQSESNFYVVWQSNLAKSLQVIHETQQEESFDGEYDTNLLQNT